MEKSNKSSGSSIPSSLKPSDVRWKMCICSACIQNVLVVVAMKVDVQVVILELFLFAFILFFDLWKKSTTSKNEYWFHLLENWMRVAWYDSYASIPCPWDPSHNLWNVSSPTYVSAVWCPVSYHHDISCRPPDVLYHIIMIFHIVFCTWRKKVSCQQGIKTLFDILCPLVPYFFSRRRVFPFEPCDGTALCFPSSVCAPANGWSSIQSEQTPSEWI